MGPVSSVDGKGSPQGPELRVRHSDLASFCAGRAQSSLAVLEVLLQSDRTHEQRHHRPVSQGADYGCGVSLEIQGHSDLRSGCQERWRWSEQDGRGLLQQLLSNGPLVGPERLKSDIDFTIKVFDANRDMFEFWEAVNGGRLVKVEHSLVTVTPRG